ncbi:biliverdin-producing heme oxygenase [Leifsonia shinshuensis]|uniref:biliverdin-producing heme oxygenase n=1 Tax=Leifsonia shinshuensis TaxID=150026 RepID=UPI001F50F7A2|nr:biliverdin-producing heme oxygenase [Leifsonia shinshuensis]MCI0156912.1 biliverdin-producing heme oxygenase [Leifsonia shinshuensis]
MAELIPFSQALRERTRTVHEQSEGATFMQDLMSGKGSREDYIHLLTQHWYIYDALEEAAGWLADDPVATLFISPKLTRLPAIEADLEFLIGTDWRDRVTALPSTLRYTARIREVGSTWPGGFVAHHYTRYLGDLSGGQIIRTLLQRQYGFETNGVGFYLFNDIAKPKVFKDVYRAQLDSVDWTDDERDRVIAEVALAFRFNTQLFDDLAASKAAAA